MKVVITDAVLSRFPQTTIGVLHVSGLTNHPSNPETDALLKTEELHIRASYQKETFTENPAITAWRKAYREFGVKPSDAKSSVENLYRLVLSGRDIRRISTLVDIYNYISLKYMLPLGGEDLDTCKGDILLTIAGEQEAPVKLLGDEKEEAPVNGEVIYKDDIATICRRWNWREAERTKLTDTTKNCILVVESLSEDGKQKIADALGELQSLVTRMCGGTSSIQILDKSNPETK